MNKQANIHGVWHGVGIQTPKEAHERSFVVPKGENVLSLSSIDAEEFEKQFMCEWNAQAKDEVGESIVLKAKCSDTARPLTYKKKSVFKNMLKEGIWL